MQLIAKVEALCVKDKATRFPTGGRSSAEVTLEGFIGDVHYGFIRKSDGRDPGIIRGTPVRNWRQWSAVSVEELQVIADTMSIKELQPWLLAANVTLSGIPDFTALPRGTELLFDGGVILTVECENTPCTLPGKEIAAKHIGKTAPEFVKAALHMRGLVGVVYRAGVITLDESVKIKLPQ